MLDDRTKAELRKSLEMQFRYTFYKDPKFAFLQSLGIKNVFQTFASDETGVIGTLHLYWTPEDSGITYADEKAWPKIKGMWKVMKDLLQMKNLASRCSIENLLRQMNWFRPLETSIKILI